MNYFNYNGKISESTIPVLGPANRGMRYGDGVFETMKWGEKGLVLADDHFARFFKGLELLKFDLPKLWTVAMFSEQVAKLTLKNKLNTARIRLTAIRGDGGLYDPVNNIPNYIIEATPLPSGNGSLNVNGIQLCIYRDGVKAIDAFSNIKHNNLLPYFMGAAFAKSKHCNDAVILNSKGNVCETTIANIFIIQKGIIYTPALPEGCIAGVMRNWLIEKIRELGFTVHESAITTTELLLADELFLSNSIFNIRWVGALEDKIFSNTLTEQISVELCAKYPDIYI
ncbi:MAG: aminotransferase class IV [Ferruginibacter sp.]